MIVRKDLPLHQIVVQSCHAAQESGLAFPNLTNEPNSLIVLTVDNQEQLLQAYEEILSKGIKLVKFFEPDWDYGYTAFASEPIYQDQRHEFKSFKLFRWGE